MDKNQNTEETKAAETAFEEIPANQPEPIEKPTPEVDENAEPRNAVVLVESNLIAIMKTFRSPLTGQLYEAVDMLVYETDQNNAVVFENGQPKIKGKFATGIFMPNTY